jgi:hypothetical protein
MIDDDRATGVARASAHFHAARRVRWESTALTEQARRQRVPALQ